MLVKLLSIKYFNKEAFKSMLKKIWRTAKSLPIFKIGDDMLFADFEDYNDKRRVMHDDPWSFNKFFILVKEFNEE